MKSLKTAACAALALCVLLPGCGQGKPAAPRTSSGTGAAAPAAETLPAGTKPETDAPELLPETEKEEISVTEITENGMEYRASGYESRENGRFRFKTGFLAEFGEYAASFNHLTIGYCADGPVKLTVTYVENGKEVADTVYLEAAENGTFGFLTASFAKGVEASALLSVGAASCTGKAVDFAITDVRAETREAAEQPTLYLENDRFKVGLNMKWGGVTTCIDDKTRGIDALTNLVNQHGIGRLIQQS